MNGQSVNGQSVNVESEIEETTNENEQANEEGATHHPAGRGPGEVQEESGARGQEAKVHAEDGNEYEGTEDPFEFEIVTKTTSTGKKTHHIFVGENKYLSRGIKKNGQAWFYCNFVSVHHKCTSSFRVRYHNLANPMDEIPAIETYPSPHIMTDGVPHLADKVKRVKESMREKI